VLLVGEKRNAVVQALGRAAVHAVKCCRREGSCCCLGRAAELLWVLLD